MTLQLFRKVLSGQMECRKSPSLRKFLEVQLCLSVISVDLGDAAFSIDDVSDDEVLSGTKYLSNSFTEQLLRRH